MSSKRNKGMTIDTVPQMIKFARAIMNAAIQDSSKINVTIQMTTQCLYDDQVDELLDVL